MKRTIEAQLLEWKDSSSRKPLILRGARQIGKTYTVRQFGRQHFTRLAMIDLERDAAMRTIFDGSLAADAIVRQIEAVTNVSLSGGDALLFIDEIQAAPRAITALRYLYEERPDIPVIAAGSALEFALGDISFPVGRVSFMWMRPMTFREFLLANDLDLLADNLPKLGEPHSGSLAVHEKIMGELKKYLLVGGMPEAVLRFVEKGSFAAAAAVHADLAASLAGSLSRYRVRIDPDSIEHVFRQLPRAVGSQVSFTHLDPDRRVEKTKASIQALTKALLVYPVHAVDAQGLPLGAGISEKRFKPLFLDVGLLQHILGVNPGEVLATRDIGSIHRGAVAEQFVGQELLAAGGSENGNLYYWSRADKRGNAEVDYLVSRGGTVYPLEVKSGAAGRMRSAHLFLTEHPASPFAIAYSPVAHEKRLDGGILFAPIYTQFDDSGRVTA
jgi:predicted AAA+ superfamily ATPase